MARIQFLRGGGCTSSINNQIQSSIYQAGALDAYFLFSRFNQYVDIIDSKASVAANEQESSEIMIAIQWFILQVENIYKLNKNTESVKKSYGLILDGIRRLLESCLIYIRTDSFKCFYVLQITDERFMKSETQNNFLEICEKLQQQIEIERNDFIQNQIELFLFLTKTSLEIAPNNSNQKQEILEGCLKGIIGSVLKMSPDAELLESLFQGACLLYKIQDITKKRKQYEVYYQLDMLQCVVIRYFKYDKQKTLKKQFSKLRQYMKHQLIAQKTGRNIISGFK